MIILDHQISKEELTEIAANIYGDMVKGVVDIERGIIAVDAELHADLEFDSLINIRPRQGNMSRDVESAEIRDIIAGIISEYIKL